MEPRVYTELSNESSIRSNYKIIDVDWLDIINVKTKIYEMGNTILPRQGAAAVAIVKSALNDKDRMIYEKTDYLCNKQENICICNSRAQDFRKMYDQNNYRPGYIGWFVKSEITTNDVSNENYRCKIEKDLK